MVKILRVQCRTEVPSGMGFIDEGIMYNFVYILATAMNDRQLHACLKAYWSQSEVERWEMVSFELVEMPIFSWYSHVATYDGNYGKGFIVVDNGVARQLLRYMRSGSWNSTFLLCQAYNWATSPNRMMFEKEHKVCKNFAKLCLKKLKGKKYKENEDGKLSSAEEYRWQ